MSYNYEIWNKDKKLYSANFTVRATSASSQNVSSVTIFPQKTETEVVFTFNGPQGVNAGL
jgi:hypothetical protein